jgi:hypothetical protein
MKKIKTSSRQKPARECQVRRSSNRRPGWREENAAAIKAYNERVSKEAILSDFDPLF